MGAGQSSVAHVVLDKATFEHGEPVTGCVVFNTHKPVQYHSVTLTVGGAGAEPRRTPCASVRAGRAVGVSLRA